MDREGGESAGARETPGENPGRPFLRTVRGLKEVARRIMIFRMERFLIRLFRGIFLEGFGGKFSRGC